MIRYERLVKSNQKVVLHAHARRSPDDLQIAFRVDESIAISIMLVNTF